MGYQWMEESRKVSVQWTSGELLTMGRLLSATLTGCGAWFLRTGFKGPVRRNPRTIGGVAAILGGMLFLAAAISPSPTQRWEIDDASVRIIDEGRITELPWKDLDSVTLDESSSKPERASLVLKRKDGERTWLAMSWLIPAHRRKILDLLERYAPRAMEAVTRDEGYRKALEWAP